MQFCPNNRRTIKVLAPMIVQRMHPGGVIITDCWKAYPEAARLAECEHWTVNHSRFFKDPETGIILFIYLTT